MENKFTKNNLAYTSRGMVFIPDIKINKLNKEHRVISISGFALIKAVFNKDYSNCIGWYKYV
jgi:hypothetical protein